MEDIKKTRTFFYSGYDRPEGGFHLFWPHKLFRKTVLGAFDLNILEKEKATIQLQGLTATQQKKNNPYTIHLKNLTS